MICPVCAYDGLPYPPKDYNICPCCSTEFGNDDVNYSHHQLRGMWVAGGANWFFGKPPESWNPWMQLLKAGLGTYVPVQFWQFSRLDLQTNASVDATFAPKFDANPIKIDLAA